MLIKAISLWPPYGDLIRLGYKKIETRSWSTSYRGWIAIHTTQFQKNNQEDILTAIDFFKQQYQEIYHDRPLLPDDYQPFYGCIVCFAYLYDCRLLGKSEEEIKDSCSLYTNGRYGFYLSDIVPLQKPIRLKGKQRLFPYEVSDNIELKRDTRLIEILTRR